MAVSPIRAIDALEVIDSRGNPTVEARVHLGDGTTGVARVPSGASTGEREATELRDGGARYGGKGVRQAVANVNGEINRALAGRDAADQQALDQCLIELDGTPNKSRLGANAILGVSMAAARAAADAAGVPLYRHLGGEDARVLPVPCLNVINGGRHADNTVDFQEFKIAPHNAPTFAEALRMGIETFHALRALLKDQGKSTGIGDEGGFAPDLATNEEAVDLILAAIEKAGYRPGADIALCLDPATSEMWRDGGYVAFKSDQSVRTTAEMIDLWRSWIDRYPIVLIEDALAENDWDGWGQLTQALGSRIELVGDDIFCTNPAILRRAIEAGRRQLDSGETEPDRHRLRDAGNRPARAAARLRRLHVAPLGRNRGYVHRRPRRRHRLRPHQDRLRLPGRAHRQVQPPAAHRARPGRPRNVRRPGRLPAGRAVSARRRGVRCAKRASSASARGHTQC